MEHRKLMGHRRLMSHREFDESSGIFPSGQALRPFRSPANARLPHSRRTVAIGFKQMRRIATKGSLLALFQ
jgi:hypothetical protein